MYSLTKIINNINIDIAGSMNVRSYLTTRQEGRICYPTTRREGRICYLTTRQDLPV
jgi:hypothetical protein